MTRLVVVMRGVIDPDASALERPLPGLAPFLESGEVTRLVPEPPPDPSATDVPEEQIFGLPHGTVRMTEGPLVTAALNAWPPERTTHFRLDVTGAQTGDPDLPHVLAALPRLETSRLRMVTGVPTSRTHGLVMDGWPDLGTFVPETGSRPDGEGDRALNALIDSAANLFSEGEWARRREDAGRSPLGVWPWAHGRRTLTPRLDLLRGEPSRVESESLRTMGLARLVGFRPSAPPKNPFAPPITDVTVYREITLDGEDPERRARILRDLTDPLDPHAYDRLLLALPHPDGGLALFYDRERAQGNGLPFEERILRDGAGPERFLSEMAQLALG